MHPKTPRALRYQVHVVGRRNAGKSTLTNALTRQSTSLVSPVPGTTTDPVRKALEFPFVGPGLLVDTAGLDDIGELGEARVRRTARMLHQADLVLFVVPRFTPADGAADTEPDDGAADTEPEDGAADTEPAGIREADTDIRDADITDEDITDAATAADYDALRMLSARQTPWILVLNDDTPGEADGLLGDDPEQVLPSQTSTPDVTLQPDRETVVADERIPAPLRRLLSRSDITPPFAVTTVNAAASVGVNRLFALIAKARAEAPAEPSVLGDLVTAGDTVVLVMPQQIQAPKGRLIMPQVQTLRELLDRHCLALSVSTEEFPDALDRLRTPPDLVVVDSQVFDKIQPLVPEGTKLTSFSVLMAAYKGDPLTFLHGAEVLRHLPGDAHILIAEACAHRPMKEDIGRVQIPRLLKRYLGDGLTLDYSQGEDWPESLEDYDLVIHCGACMFGRTHVMERLRQLGAVEVPVTNYGMAIAALHGILPHIVIPGIPDALMPKD